MRVFVTVGTTSFDELLAMVDSESFRQVLRAKGCKDIEIQLGGTSKFAPRAAAERSEDDQLPLVSAFGVAPSIQSSIDAADIIICHSGAGTLLQCLKAGKKILAVVNRRLMNNHQLELAQALEENNHLIVARELKDLTRKFLEVCEVDEFVRLPEGDAKPLWDAIDEEIQNMNC